MLKKFTIAKRLMFIQILILIVSILSIVVIHTTIGGYTGIIEKDLEVEVLSITAEKMP